MGAGGTALIAVAAVLVALVIWELVCGLADSGSGSGTNYDPYTGSGFGRSRHGRRRSAPVGPHP